MTICPTCGIKFTPTTVNPTYCTPACWPQVQAERAAAATAAANSKATTSTIKPKRRTRSRTRSERFATLNAFVDFGIADADLTPAEALVWFVLYRDTKADGFARTGQADIARRAGLSVRGVKKAIRGLNAKGMVDVVRRGRLNVGPSFYRVSPTRRMG
jgi:CRP-like cAMP-binding protein